MIVPKGYRARENAALQRKARGRVDEEVRAQRAALLEPKIHNAVVKSRDSYEIALVEAPVEVSEPVVQPAVEVEQPAQVNSENGGDETIFEEDDRQSQDEAPADEQPEQSAQTDTPEVAPPAEQPAQSKPAKSKSKSKNK
jgi:hypothetical protein